MSSRRSWEHRRRAKRDVPEELASENQHLDLYIFGACRACGLQRPLDEWGHCDCVEGWEDEYDLLGESPPDPTEWLSLGPLTAEELLARRHGGHWLNHGRPPDDLDWGAWLVGDELYFFRGACRACGAALHFDESEIVCERCLRARGGTLWWIR